jgi:hypothetical protein
MSLISGIVGSADCRGGEYGKASSVQLLATAFRCAAVHRFDADFRNAGLANDF